MLFIRTEMEYMILFMNNCDFRLLITYFSNIKLSLACPHWCTGCCWRMESRILYKKMKFLAACAKHSLKMMQKWYTLLVVYLEITLMYDESLKKNSKRRRKSISVLQLNWRHPEVFFQSQYIAYRRAFSPNRKEKKNQKHLW